VRTLVTGAAGFIGSYLVERLDGQVLELDLKWGEDVNDPFVAKDIATFDPEVVFHLAALHHVPWCREHPKETLETNVLGFDRVLRALDHVRTVVLASSAAVYGFGPKAFAEWDTPNPVDIYGMSKLIDEELLSRYSEQHPNVACVSARLFNVVGSGDLTPHLVPTLAQQVGTGDVKIGNLSPLRDYVHVGDVAHALTELAQFSLAGYRVVNVGTGVGTSVGQVLDAFRDLGFHFRVESDAERERSNDGDLVAAERYPGCDRGIHDAIADIMEVAVA